MTDFFRDFFETLPLRIEDCGRATVGPGLPFDWSSSRSTPFLHLEHCRIYRVRRGQAQVATTSGSVELRAGNLYFFAPNAILATRCETPMEHDYVHFSILLPIDWIPFLRVRGACPETGGEAELFARCGRVSGADPADFLQAQGALRLLLAPFFAGASLQSADIERFRGTLQFIEEHLADETLNVPLLAAQMHLNPVYFSNRFARAFGLPPSRYLRQKRLERARALLLSGDLPIQEIAAACGCADPEYFTRVFHAQCGLTPSDFRRRYRSAQQNRETGLR